MSWAHNTNLCQSIINLKLHIKNFTGEFESASAKLFLLTKLYKISDETYL